MNSVLNSSASLEAATFGSLTVFDWLHQAGTVMINNNNVTSLQLYTMIMLIMPLYNNYDLDNTNEFQLKRN